MQGATHHEAVSALRNAGSCIKMKVLRDRLLHQEVCDLDKPQDAQVVKGRQLCSQDGGGQRSKQSKMESTEDCLSKKIEAVVCNGNGIVGGLLKLQHKQNLLFSNFTIVLQETSSHLWITPSSIHSYSLCFLSCLFISSLIWRAT